MDTDTPNGDAEPKPKTRIVKKQIRKGELPVSSASSSLDSSSKNLLAERENAMQVEDKLVTDTEDKKNELESYIYELRDKIDGVYSEFANEDEKTKLKAKLDETEVLLPWLFPCVFPPETTLSSLTKTNLCFKDWLYDEGDDSTKATYVAKMDEVRFIAGPIVQRYQDKLEAERQAQLKAQEEAAAKRTADEDAKKAEEESKKKAEEDAKKKDAPAADAEMKDADAADGNGDTPMTEAEVD